MDTVCDEHRIDACAICAAMSVSMPSPTASSRAIRRDAPRPRAAAPAPPRKPARAACRNRSPGRRLFVEPRQRAGAINRVSRRAARRYPGWRIVMSDHAPSDRRARCGNRQASRCRRRTTPCKALSLICFNTDHRQARDNIRRSRSGPIWSSRNSRAALRRAISSRASIPEVRIESKLNLSARAVARIVAPHPRPAAARSRAGSPGRAGHEIARALLRLLHGHAFRHAPRPTCCAKHCVVLVGDLA